MNNMTENNNFVSKTHETLYRMTLSAMFLAIGLILPFFTGQIREIGHALLPMHLPVLLCGLICGWQYGAVVGLTAPLLRSVLFGMPVMFPNAVAMSVELAVYGLCVGLVYGLFKKQNVLAVYVSLLPAMILGRVAWGGMQVLLAGMQESAFGITAFLTRAFLNAIPGLALQLLLIPAVMVMLDKTGARRFRRTDKQA